MREPVQAAVDLPGPSAEYLSTGQSMDHVLGRLASQIRLLGIAVEDANQPDVQDPVDVLLGPGPRVPNL